MDRNEEGEEQLHLRRLQLPFNFATGEAMLYDVAPAIGPPETCSAPKQRKLDNGSISPNSILGCMMNQDQSLYHNNNTVASVDDLAFKDTHATLSVPGDVWVDATLKNMTGNLVTSEATLQDMMDTLQQILGEDGLGDTLDVEPDELKSWESTLLKLSTSCDVSDDLCDILSSDVLTYVEEQLQQEGAFRTPEQLEERPQSRAHEDWTSEPQSQPGAPLYGTMKLSHLDLPQLSPAEFEGPNLQLIGFQPEPCVSEQPGAENGGLGAFSLRRPADRCHQAAQPIQNHPEPNPAFNFGGNPWISASGQVERFPDSYVDHASSRRGFVANPAPSGCLQRHVALRDQNSDRQWSLDQQQLLHHTSARPQHAGACLNQRNPLHGAITVQAVNGGSMSEASEVPHAAPHSLTSRSCIFGNAGPSPPSCHRLNPTSNHSNQSSCLYGGVFGSGAVPGATIVLNPNETALTCKASTAFGPKDLLVQPQPYLDVGDSHTQVRAQKSAA